MITDKANTMCLLTILREYSDAEHILRMGDIIKKMELLYGTAVDRRTVYGSINLLIELGYDISTYEDNGRGYYLCSREFELSEIYLLMESVYSNAAIPRRYTEDLIRKIQQQGMSIYKRREYKHLTVVHDDVKTSNREVFLNIELLDGAITKKKKVTFVYLQYDFDKKLKPRRDRTYTVSPYAMVSANEHFYLVCKTESFNDIGQYRIDKIKDLVVTGERAEPVPKGFDVRKHVQSAVYMFSNDIERVTLRCDNKVLDDIIDKFGQGVRLSPNDDGTFTANVTASRRGIQFWALQYLEYVEVLGPKAVRNGIIKAMKTNIYMR